MQIFIVKFTQDSCLFCFYNNRPLFRNDFLSIKKTSLPEKKNVLIWLVLKKLCNFAKDPSMVNTNK